MTKMIQSIEIATTYLENRSFSSFEEPYGHEVY